jgi:hypothetical protein
MDGYKLSSINFFHTQSRYPYQSIERIIAYALMAARSLSINREDNCICPYGCRKFFEKYDVSLPFITAPIKSYTSIVNCSPHCCRYRAKKLVPSSFFFQDRTSPPIGSHPTGRCFNAKVCLLPMLQCLL